MATPTVETQPNLGPGCSQITQPHDTETDVLVRNGAIRHPGAGLTDPFYLAVVEEDPMSERGAVAQ
jgi:hypothetical protein